jgi:leader peptidase (prepilin peptidase)/N-methyltransferase
VIETALAFVFGLLIGSFLNVCIYRWTRGLSVVRPRSACPACGNMIAWYDNVPLVSFALLRGRCRHCGAAISWRYPVIELLAGLACAAAVFRFGLTVTALKTAVFGSICIALVATDLTERLLPDYFTVGGTATGILFALFDPLEPLFPYSGDSRVWRSVLEALAGAAVPSFAMWCLGEVYYRLRKREGIALGDVKMIGMIGAFLGLRGSLLVLVIGSVTGAVIGLAYVLMARKSAATYPIPFGVFLGIASIVVAWFGESLMRAWLAPSGF